MGASIGLNRIGVAYFKSHKFSKSMKFHLKHLEFTDKDNVFAAYYNLGICYRILGYFSQSNDYFTKSLEWAQLREDVES